MSNIPNILSLLRILMIPVVAISFYHGNYASAAIVFLIACFTDVVDGYLARRFGWITDIGKILDPLADKGMQLTVLISLAMCGRMPRVAAYLVLIKELAMFLGGVFLYKHRIVVAANWYGKAATVVISLCVTTVLLFYDFLPSAVLIIAQWLPVFAALGAFILYFIAFIKSVREVKLI